MGRESNISWTDATFNPWRGCTKVSAGCANCYAERTAVRNPSVLGIWGDQGSRVVAVEGRWAELLKWDRDASQKGQRLKVFCASLADVFEQWPGMMTTPSGNPYWWCGGSLCNSPLPSVTRQIPNFRLATMDDIRARLFDTVEETPNLDWLILTKRPEAILDTTRRVQGPGAWWYRSEDGPDGPVVAPPKNVWMGASVENQPVARRRIEALLAVPAAVRWLSVEPMIGPLNLRAWLCCPLCQGRGYTMEFMDGNGWGEQIGCDCRGRSFIDWVVVGGESGPDARPLYPEWVRDVKQQCREAGVPFFFKQGSQANWGPGFKSPDSWPEEFRVQEFPTPRIA